MADRTYRRRVIGKKNRKRVMAPKSGPQTDPDSKQPRFWGTAFWCPDCDTLILVYWNVFYDERIRRGCGCDIGKYKVVDFPEKWRYGQLWFIEKDNRAERG